MKIVNEEILIDTLHTDDRQFITDARSEVIAAIRHVTNPKTSSNFYFHPHSRTKTVNGANVGGNGVKPIKVPFIDHLNQCGWANEYDVRSSMTYVRKIEPLQHWGNGTTVIYGTVVNSGIENGQIPFVEIITRQGDRQKYPIDPTVSTSNYMNEISSFAGRIVSLTLSSPGAVDATKPTPAGIFAVEWETGNVSSSHRALNKMALLQLYEVIVAGILVIPTRSMYYYLTDRIGNFEEVAPYFDVWKNLTPRRAYLEIIAIEHDGVREDAIVYQKGSDGNAKKRN